MYLEPFSKRFPELGADECRTITLVERGDGADSQIPEGTYAFTEHYCADPKCDCRRVMLVVMSPLSPRPLASISYAFDRDDPMAGPFLDPFNRNCSYAGGLLEMAEELLFSDPKYVARLERHYELMKEAVGMRKAKVRLDPAEVGAAIAQKKATRQLQRKALARLDQRRKGR